jgi:hypothetical protein
MKCASCGKEAEYVVLGFSVCEECKKVSERKIQFYCEVLDRVTWFVGKALGVPQPEETKSPSTAEVVEVEAKSS